MSDRSKKKPSYVSTFVAGAPRLKCGATLRIADFEEVRTRMEPGKSIESDVFSIGSNSFALSVYPRGIKDGDGRKVGIYLSNKTVSDVKVKSCTVSVSSESYNPMKDETIKSLVGRGWSFQYIGIMDSLSDGVLEVKMDVEMEGEKVVVNLTTDEDSMVKNQAQAILRTLYEDGLVGADFLLVCAGEEVAAHRIILQGASPYFKAMMVPERSEYKKGRTTMDCTGEMGRELVKFLYTSKLDTDILEENVIAFLRVADMYLLDGLKDMTERLMVNLLNKQNMVEFFVAGSRYNGERICETAKKFVLSNLRWLKQQEGWKDRFGKDIELIVELAVEVLD